MTRTALTWLMVLALAIALPLRTTAAPVCPCHASENPQSTPANSTGCCPLTPASHQQPDAQPTDKPADRPADQPGDHSDCDCPLACCGIVKAPATVPVRPVPTAGDAVVAPVRTAADIRAGSPHLLGLRRPPRAFARA